jgi:hypothetical protein
VTPAEARVRAAVEAAIGRRLLGDEVEFLGRAPWLAREARERRDRLLRELGGLFGGTVNARAARLRSELLHYGGAGWPHDRRRGTAFPPSRRRAMLFELFSLGGEVPQSVRRLTTILAGTVCNE